MVFVFAPPPQASFQVKGLYKISAATPRLHLGDAAANAEEMTRLARKAAESGVAAIVFPELSVTGYTCGDVFFRSEFLDAAEKALADFATATAGLPIVSIVGFPEKSGPAIYNSAAVVFAGKVVGIVRKRCLPTYREYYEARQFTPAPRNEPPKVFKARGLSFCVEICEDLWAAVPPSSLAAARWCASRASASAAPMQWHAPASASRARMPSSAETP